MLKVDIRYEVNGKPVPPNQFKDELRTASMEAILKGTEEYYQQMLGAKLDNLTCPEHNQIPKIEVALSYNPNSSQPQIKGNIEIDGCCQPLIDEVASIINSLS